jgi:hypothetical protein
MALPGCFLSIDLGDQILSDPSNVIDVSNLNFAMVMSIDAEPVESRWTTWGIEADSLYLYQSTTNKNKVIAGNAGYLYSMSDEVYTDGGNAIPIVISTTPLPAVDDSTDAYTMKRLHSVIWEVHTPPPSSGYEITLTVTDVNDETNTITRTVTQYATRMEVDIALKARQFRIRLSTSVNKDFDLVLLGYKFQVMNARKATYLS